MLRKLFALLAASATATAGLVAVHAAAPASQLPSAAAADAADFTPGNLISDENFYDGLAMSAQEVQAFLEEQNPSGSPTALRNYRQHTPSLEADAYCAAYQGAEDESAASIIARVGEACNLSPKAMLVLLEKEQSLVSAAEPGEGRLAAATGFGCPDTAPCDSSVAGFFYQIYYAARQFQVYRANPYNYNHIPHATNNILYNPNFACGSAPVHIENDATAGLYNYTPYQPNQSALANLYGEGDGCAAYGNRNFWRMYTDWFGDARSTDQAAASLVQSEEGGEVFLVVDGTRHRVPEQHLAAFEPLGAARRVAAATLQAMPQGPDASNIVRGANGWVYLLSGEGKRWTFVDCETAEAYGSGCESAVQISDAQFRTYAFAGTVYPLVRTPDGMNLYVEGGAKREVTGLGVLKVRGYDTSAHATRIDASLIEQLPYGEPMWGVGAVVVGESQKTPLLLDGAGTAHAIPESMHDFGWLAPSTISDASYAKITVSGSLAPAMTDGTNHYIATERGMLRVNRAQYGQSVEFAPIPASFAKHVRLAGAAEGPHIVQEIGSEEASIVSGGQRATFPNLAGAEAEARKRGVDTTVHRVVPGLLEKVAGGNGVGNGALLLPENGEQLYILDGAHLQPVASAEIAAELGFATTPVRITQASFDRIPQREQTLDVTRLRCGEQEWLAIGGKRYPLTSPELQAAYGQTGRQVSSLLCSLVPTASEPLGDFLKGPDGTVYWLEGGKRRAVSSPEVVAQMGGEQRAPLEASEAALAQFPLGEPLSAMPDGYVPPASGEAPKPAETGAPEPPATTTPDATTPAPGEQEQVEQVEPGEVLTDPKGSGIWLRTGEGLVQIGSQSVADSLGLDVRAPREVTGATIDSFRDRTVPLYTSAVRCGGVAYLGIDGQLVPYASEEAERAFGLQHVELGAETCTKLTVALETTIDLEVRLPDGTLARVEDGALRPVTGAPAEGQAPATEAPATQTPAGQTPAEQLPGTETPATQTPGGEPAPSESAPSEPAPSEPAPGEAEPGEPAREPVRLTIELVSAMKRGEPVPE